jgi:hypothetical protein
MLEYTRRQAEQMRKDWDNSGIERFDHFLDVKFSKVKSGMWVKSENQSGIMLYVTKVGVNALHGYGIHSDGSWGSDTPTWFASNIRSAQPATYTEVIEANRKYAESIGLVEGVWVRCLSSGKRKRLKYADIEKNGEIWGRGTCGHGILLMQNGVWTTPIKSDIYEKLEEIEEELERIKELINKNIK